MGLISADLVRIAFGVKVKKHPNRKLPKRLRHWSLQSMPIGHSGVRCRFGRTKCHRDRFCEINAGFVSTWCWIMILFVVRWVRRLAVDRQMFRLGWRNDNRLHSTEKVHHSATRWSDRSTTAHIVLNLFSLAWGLWGKLYDCSRYHFTANRRVPKCAIGL